MEKFYGICRLITLAIFILLMVMYYSFINNTNDKVEEAVTDYALTIEKYFSEIIDMDIERNKTLFQFLESSNIFYEGKENLNNQEVVSEIKEFNLFYINESKSFFIFNDGSYVTSDGMINEYFESRDLRQEKFYKDTLENYNLTVIPYSEYTAEKMYMYTKPILNKNGELLGIAGRMCKIDWLISRFINTNKKINAEIVIETNENELLAILKTNGDVYKVAREEYYNEANKIKQNRKSHKYTNEEIGVNIYILPQESLIKNTYNNYRLYSNLISIIVCVSIVIMIMKLKDMRVINLIIFTILILFYTRGYISFKNAYTDVASMNEQLKFNIYEEKIKIREESVMLNLEYISSKVYEGVGLAIKRLNVRMQNSSEAKNGILMQRPRDRYHNVIEFLNYNALVYIMFDDNTKLSLSTFEIVPFNDMDKHLYKKCIENNSAYYNSTLQDNTMQDIIATRMCKVNLSNNVFLVLESSGNVLSEFEFNITDIINNQKFWDGYLIKFNTGKNEVYELRNNKYEIMTLNNKLSNTDEVYKRIIDKLPTIKENSNLIFNDKMIDRDEKLRSCVIYKKDDLKQLIISFIDYEDIYIIKDIVSRYMEYTFVTLLLITVMEFLVMILLKMKRKQKESVVLHNNY